MDKLLTIRERNVEKVKLPLAIESEPKTSYDNASYCPMVEDLRKWLNDGNADAGFVSGASGSGVTTLIKAILKESDIDLHHVDHMAKNFTELLEDTNKISRSIYGKRIVVVIDGVDSSAVGKRILGTVSDHVSKGIHKFVCIGHREKKLSSNDFAKKWVIFDLPTPDDSVLFDKLKNIARGKVSDVAIAKIVKQNPPGSIRSCINALEMQILNPSEKIDAMDEFVDGIDGIDYIFKNNDDSNFATLLKIFEQEPWMIKNGAYENYLKFFTSIQTVSRIADSLSISDSLFDHPDSDITYADCAFAVGDIKLATKTKNAVVTKFGTLWSKMNYQKINANKHKNIAEHMREKNFLDIPSVDLDYLREILRKDYSEEVLEEPEFLQLFRTGFRSYTHNKRNFVKN